LAGIFGMVAPFAFGMDGFNGGFAIAFFCIVFTITAFFVTLMYARMARTAQGMLNGEDLLAHWRYTPEEWQVYTEKQFTADKSDKKGIFLILVVIAAIAAVVALVIDAEAGKFVALVLLGVVVLVGIVAYTSSRYDHYENLKFQGQAYISRNAVLLNRRLHLWKGWGSQLEDVTYEDGKLPILKFEYSTPSGKSRGFYTARIPVPQGKEDQAQDIVKEIARVHNV